MSDPFEQMIAYLKLSRAYRQRSMLSGRDRALLLAGIYAHHARLVPISSLCRQLILQNNPGHTLRNYPDFTQAMEDEDFNFFTSQVSRKIPYEKVSFLLAELSFDDDFDRDHYTNDSEYAAAILGVDAGWIKENFG